MIVFRESSAFNGFGMKYKSKAVVRYLMIPQFMHHAKERFILLSDRMHNFLHKTFKTVNRAACFGVFIYFIIYYFCRY